MPQISSEGPHQATLLPDPRWREPGVLFTPTTEPDILRDYSCQRVVAGNNYLVNKETISNKLKSTVTFFITFHRLEPRLLVTSTQHLKVYKLFLFNLQFSPTSTMTFKDTAVKQ